MKGDFSRNTYRASSRFSSVLMQQGRVLLDADFNEQAGILLHYMRTLAADMIGPNVPGTRFRHGGPGDSFQISAATDANKNNTIGIAPGRYYVDGILCENRTATLYGEQDDWPLDEDKVRLDNGSYLVFLDVWERLITPIEDAYIQEVALGDADTCVRSQVVWQVKTLRFAGNVLGPGETGDRPTRGKASTKSKAAASKATAKAVAEPKDAPQGVDGALDYLATQHSSARMAARLKPGVADPDPCITPPDSRYRGAENQLYRVEINTPGTGETATFKWSRDNGSVTFPVESYESTAAQTLVQLKHLGRDYRSSLEVGDWVEAMDDIRALREQPGKLLKVVNVDSDNLNVTLDGPVSIDLTRHPLLRRWDHRVPSNDVSMSDVDNAFKVDEGHWLTLEDGVQIMFDPSEVEDEDNNTKTDRVYFTGDYWLIPARVNTGDIEWPDLEDEDNPDNLIWPQGVHHHYAPLAILSVTTGSIKAEEEYKDADGNTVPLRRPLASIPLIGA